MARAARFLAWVCLLIAALAAITDLTRSSAQDAVVVTSALEHWRQLAPQLLAAAQASLRRIPLFWDLVLRPPLLLPAWALFGLIGLVFAVLGRRRKTVNIFAN